MCDVWLGPGAVRTRKTISTSPGRPWNSDTKPPKYVDRNTFEILYVNLWPVSSEVFFCRSVSVCFWWLCLSAHVTLMSGSRKRGWSPPSQSYLLRHYLRNATYSQKLFQEFWIAIFTLEVFLPTFLVIVWKVSRSKGKCQLSRWQAW